ncbi:hypothetical protein QFZ22_008277 [Streptomyces canus]|uniref:Uncharacterized protein n=1 Tax=Streptomyces canus TaxID=58343 RepID=A0AAW8FTB6_9ACTN|nr:hypothetical protein [Streptomyces canus]MDQ0912292.1 hypothetical protein [Streptomyces canus]
MKRRSRLVALPAVDGKQYGYRVYAPGDALLADLFREVWRTTARARSRSWGLFDAAVIRQVG